MSPPLRRASSTPTFPPSPSPAPLLPLRPPRTAHDPAKAAAFASRLVSCVNDSAVCLLISLGHQLGLFAVLARLPHPLPAADIARLHALHPRYVAEWLAAMACVGVVEETPRAPHPLFWLPPSHAALLTAGPRVSNMALLAQYVPTLARLEKRVAACFRTGAGIRASEFAHFDAVASLDLLHTVADDLDATLRERVPALENCASVLCAGRTADEVFVRLARAFPSSWFTVYVATQHHLETGRARLAGPGAGGVTNLRFRLTQGLHAVREQCSYDAALILDGSAVREARSPAEALRAVYGALRPEKPLIYVETVAEGCPIDDVGHPVGELIYTISAMRALPGVVERGGETVGGVWGSRKAEKVMKEVGFVAVDAGVDDGINCVLVGWTAKEGESDCG